MKDLTEFDFPIDLKTMSLEEMDLLAIEIRDFLISNISKTGGHLASNLGVVELSIALHKIFDLPKDKIVWDVGHQSYVHKILTGRAGAFTTLRQLNGLSGFPKNAESDFDAFDTGHSSTSISVVSGMAAARDLQGQDYETIAVIGDGALTGGLAYEGLNNLGVSRNKAIVILNDNAMAIGQNTGGISNHLGKLRVSKGYYDLKRAVTGAVDKIPAVGKNLHSGISKLRDSLKYALVDGIMFEELGFTYLGPIDGHNLPALLESLSLAKAAEGSV
ncbi:MAG: 1-deoxy-D-xylulose-5-phosphate synthase N-terminal domain-containing protein, partial [Anaerovoracaceae bacterium]